MSDGPGGHVAQLVARERKLRDWYETSVEAQTVRWQGETGPWRRLRPGLESSDRRVRERAWRVGSDCWLADGPEFGANWTSLVAVRMELARDHGNEAFPAWRRRQLGYPTTTLEETHRAQLAIEEFVTSVLVRLHEHRRRQLGLRTIRPWDLLAAPPRLGAEPWLTSGAAASEVVTARLGTAFDRRETNALTRVPIGSLSSDADVEEYLDHVASSLMEDAALEFDARNTVAEDVASLALQLAVFHGDSPATLLDSAPTAAIRVRIRQLERTLLNWCFGAMMDVFERWTYAQPERAALDGRSATIWSSLWLRFLPAVDWSGLEDTLAMEWQRHRPLFVRPGESMIRVASELNLMRNRSQSGNSTEWLAALDLFGPPALGNGRPVVQINETDLLEVARWMEDTIEELETARAV